MRASRSLRHVTTILLSLSPLVSASWLLPDMDALVVRADTTKAPAPTKTPSPKDSSSNDSPNTFNLNTGGISQTGTGTDAPSETGKGKSGGHGGNSTMTSKGPKHSEFDPTDPAGAVVMVTPAATAPTQLYKIGSTITWKWNYTNLLGTPTAVDVLATCTAATRLYTLTSNMTFATQGSFTWDTNAYTESVKASPLVIDQYTLIIHDSDSSISATADPGYLGTFNQFQFGMYTPQPYTPLASGWQCASCSAAPSDMDRRAIGFALSMCLVTVFSFTWFVTGFGAALW